MRYASVDSLTLSSLLAATNAYPANEFYAQERADIVAELLAREVAAFEYVNDAHRVVPIGGEQ